MPLPPITLRLVKGSPLTAAEGDGNLTLLRDFVNGLEARMNVSLNSDGTLKAASVTAASIPAGIITIDKFDPSILPIGTILGLASGTIPSGWLECKGQAIPRGSYGASLFALISTTYGIGDGATTFNIPDLQGRVPLGEGAGASTYARGDKVGAETVLLDDSEVPSLIQSSWNLNDPDATSSGGYMPVGEGPLSVPNGLHIDPLTMNPGGGNAHENRQPSLCITFIIRVT